MVDIKSGQQRVAVKYLQSESDMMARLEDLRTLRATFAPCPSLPQPPDAPGACHNISNNVAACTGFISLETLCRSVQEPRPIYRVPRLTNSAIQWH